MAKSKIPQSTFGRASRLLLSGAKIAARELTDRLSSKLSTNSVEHNAVANLATKVRQTQDLVDALGDLKGAAMKAGQLLSLEFSDLLPPEVNEILRKLHDSSTFMPFDQVRYILSRELGPEKLGRIENLTSTPIASASIGQVHRGTIDGADVAVKIQFPGVANTIDSDLNALRRLVNTWIQLRGRSINFDEFFAELAVSFKREADYISEADSVEKYGSKIRSSQYAVPYVFREFSSKKVLTLTYEEGVRINDWIKAKPSPVQAQEFGQLLIHLLIEEFFSYGIVQTDPNYGNFLFRPEKNQIVLLDFGATNEYDVKFREEIRTLFNEIRNKDFQKVLKLITEYGFLDPREPQEVLDLLLEMLKRIVLIFSPLEQPFKFNNEKYLKDIRDISFKFVTRVQYSPPAKKLALLNRKLGGVFHLLKDLNLELDMRPTVNLVLEKPILES